MSIIENIRRSAVFLDRDGTIIEDCGDLSLPSQVAFFRDTVPALLCLRGRFDLFIVTNQSGVAKGTITVRDVARVNAHVTAYLAGQGVPVRRVYVCPHARGDGCGCIKPNPYFLHEAEREYGVDLRRSYVIGDHPHDVVFAHNAGARGIYVLSGHGRRHLGEIPEATIVVEGIREPADLILAEQDLARTAHAE